MKNILRIAFGTGLILLIPLIAMQFTSDVNWTLTDFITAGALLFGTGLLFDFAIRTSRSTAHRVAFGAMIVVGFLTVWAELAVGIFTNFGS